MQHVARTQETQEIETRSQMLQCAPWQGDKGLVGAHG